MAPTMYSDPASDPYATVRSTNSHRHGHQSVGSQGIFAPLETRDECPSHEAGISSLDDEELLLKQPIHQAGSALPVSKPSYIHRLLPSGSEHRAQQEAIAHHRWSSWTGTTAFHSHSGSDHDDTDHDRSGMSLDEDCMSSSLSGSRRPSADFFGAEYTGQVYIDADNSRTSAESASSAGVAKRRRRHSGEEVWNRSIEPSPSRVCLPPEIVESLPPQAMHDDEAALDAAIESTARAFEQATALLRSTFSAQQDLVRFRATQEVLGDSMALHEARLMQQIAQNRRAKELVAKATSDISALVPASRRVAAANGNSAPRPTHWRLPSFGAAPMVAPPTHSRNESAGASWLKAKDVDATIGKSAARRLEKALSASAAAAAAAAAAAGDSTNQEQLSSAGGEGGDDAEEGMHGSPALSASSPVMPKLPSRAPSVASVVPTDGAHPPTFAEAAPTLPTHRRSSSSSASAAAALAALNGGHSHPAQPLNPIREVKQIGEGLVQRVPSTDPETSGSTDKGSASRPRETPASQILARNRMPKGMGLRLVSMPSSLAPAITSSASSAEHSPLSSPSPGSSTSFSLIANSANGQSAASGSKSPTGYFNPYLRKSRDRGDRSGSRASLASLGSLASIDERLASPSPTTLSRPTSALGVASSVTAHAGSVDARTSAALPLNPNLTSRTTLTPAMAALSANAGRRAVSGASSASSASASVSSQATLKPSATLRAAASLPIDTSAAMDCSSETGFDGDSDTSARLGFESETDGGEMSTTHFASLSPFSAHDRSGQHGLLGHRSPNFAPHRSPRLSRAKGRGQHSASSSISESAHGWLSAGVHGSSSESEDVDNSDGQSGHRQVRDAASRGHRRKRSATGSKGALAALRRLNGASAVAGEGLVPHVVQENPSTSPALDDSHAAAASASHSGASAAQSDSEPQSAGWRGSLTSWMRAGSVTPA
ncbi:hypothetical protein IE81DRAFT_322532 [Ceraceosorus guamensis]|uniref:Uncharacterized protein n=1 Tax=Ceraceosorus guamensis TaxID=1522189 RepID=A0A316W0D4_9BASI|nr:hypothetical protein IE81DRAFT_322532 [Ceraceosorus guamensis]PWN43240.1 hypothetical protein IE81DRAFT_322532 [Ceraceosorus guamensis]